MGWLSNEGHYHLVCRWTRKCCEFLREPSVSEANAAGVAGGQNGTVAVVITADLIREARLRAGLSQAELAARLQRPKSTVTRWETGVRTPSLETTREVIRACDLELSLGVFRFDDSYNGLIDMQFAKAPLARLESLTDDADALARTLELLPAVLAAIGSVLIIGRFAEALHGSPIALPAPLPIEFLVEDSASADRALRSAGLEPYRVTANRSARIQWRLPDTPTLEFSLRTDAPGTQGLTDLRRDASNVNVAPEAAVPVPSLRDLVRINQASPEDRARIVALRTTLERAPRRTARRSL